MHEPNQPLVAALQQQARGSAPLQRAPQLGDARVCCLLPSRQLSLANRGAACCCCRDWPSMLLLLTLVQRS